MIEADPSIVPLTPHQKTGLDERYAKSKNIIHLDNLDQVSKSVVQVISDETVNQILYVFVKYCPG